MAYTSIDIRKYFKRGDSITVDGVTGTLDYVGKTELTIKAPGAQKIAYERIKHIAEFEAKEKLAASSLNDLKKAGAVLVKAETWAGLSQSSGPVLVEVAGGVEGPGHFSYLCGLVTVDEGIAPEFRALKFHVDSNTQKNCDAHKRTYDPLSQWGVYDGVLMFFTHVSNVYLLKGVNAGTAAEPEKVDPAPETGGSEPEQPPAICPSPLLLGGITDAHFNTDSLPDMTGFDPSHMGVAPCVWSSPGYLLADRDLAVGETLSVWVLGRDDGRVLKAVSLKATQANRSKAAWPKALSEAINADTTNVEGSVLLQAGHFAEDGTFAVAATGVDSAAFKKTQDKDKAGVDRVWVFGSHARVFSNAPFASNQVIAQHLPDALPAAVERVCVQVRHRTSQRLYESFVINKDADTAKQVQKLCEALNKSSQMLRAGVRGKDGVTIAPGEKGNAIWVPQFSELSVSVEAVTWRAYGEFEAKAGLKKDQALYLNVHDDVTGLPLPGSPFVFKPTAQQLAANQWPAALAAALRASPMAAYLRLGSEVAGSDTLAAAAKTGTWWQASLPLRIWMSEPMADALWVPAQAQADDTGQAVTLSAMLAEAGVAPDEGSAKQTSVLELRDKRSNTLCYSWRYALEDKDAAKRIKQLADGISGQMEADSQYWCRTDTPLRSSTADNAPTHEGAVWVREEMGMALVVGGDDGIEVATVDFPKVPTNLYLAPEMKTLVITAGFAGVLCLSNDRPYGGSDSARLLGRALGLSSTFDGFSKLSNAERYAHQDCVAVRRFITELVRGDFTVAGASELSKLKWLEFRITRVLPTAENLSPKVREALRTLEECAPALFDHADRARLDHSLFSEFENNQTFMFLGKSFVCVACDCTGESIDIAFRVSNQVVVLQLRVPSEGLVRGVRFSACNIIRGGVLITFKLPGNSSYEQQIIHASFLTAQGLQHSPQPIKVLFADYGYDNRDTLCADNSMTQGAHVYDTTGATENGVDERTGLFHSHYPVAHLRGLAGKGPDLDLSLHYSAIRANESALGDGWAFRFSSFDNRTRVLTLSTGQTLRLSKQDMKELSADPADRIEKVGFRITRAKGNEDGLTSLTVQYPYSGGREEILSMPSEHDNKEAGESYKTTYKEKLQKVIDNLTRWIEKESLSDAQINDYKKEQALRKAELADIDREAMVLVSSSIKTPQGGELELAWEGLEGHVRLLRITDKAGTKVLLQAKHDKPVAKGSYHSTFTLWPGTAESYEVTLDIEDCLLKTLTRHRADAQHTPEQKVTFGYSMDPAVDRVLTSVAEEDGSIELVNYTSVGDDAPPRVAQHSVIPGAGQANITHAWEWKGDYFIKSAIKRLCTGEDPLLSPSVRTDWVLREGIPVVGSVTHEQPGGTRRTTQYTYSQGRAPDEPWMALHLTQPVSTTVTTEDLPASPAKEQQS